MAKLLVSVRDAEEAALALASGADLIDVKEPSRGALGPADPQTWTAVARCVDGRCPVSVALGELLTDTVTPETLTEAPVHYAKIGLAGCAPLESWTTRWAASLDRFPPHVVPVAVAYADFHDAGAPSPSEVLDAAINRKCPVLLIDTYKKTGSALFQHLAESELASLLDRARSHQQTVVLGGSLNDALLPRALRFSPDYVAVRGAVCDQDRAAQLNPARVRNLVRRLQELTAPRELA